MSPKNSSCTQSKIAGNSDALIIQKSAIWQYFYMGNRYSGRLLLANYNCYLTILEFWMKFRKHIIAISDEACKK